MNLQQFQAENPDLWPNVEEWIREGWGVTDSVDITALMVAAALQKEADFQDGCVERGESAASYPIRLRHLAGQLARTASDCLGSPDTDKSGAILAVRNFQIIGCLDPAQYEGAEAEWPHGWAHMMDGPAFDQIDVELLSEDMAQAYIGHFRPQHI